MASIGLNIFQFEFLDDATCLLVVVDGLSDVDAVESVRLVSRGDPRATRFLASRFRSTTPINRVLRLVVLRIKKTAVRQQRPTALAAFEVELLIVHRLELHTAWRFLVKHWNEMKAALVKVFFSSILSKLKF